MLLSLVKPHQSGDCSVKERTKMLQKYPCAIGLVLAQQVPDGVYHVSVSAEVKWLPVIYLPIIEQIAHIDVSNLTKFIQYLIKEPSS